MEVVVPAEDLEGEEVENGDLVLDGEDLDLMMLGKKAKKKKAAKKAKKAPAPAPAPAPAAVPAPAPAPAKKKPKKKKFFLAEMSDDETSNDVITMLPAFLISFIVGSALTFAAFKLRRRAASTASEALL